MQAARAVAAGEADAFVSGGSTGAALAAGLFDIKRARGIYRPALAVARPDPRRADHAARRRRQHRGAQRAPRPVRLHGRGARARPCSASSARASALLSNGEEAGQGHAEVVEAHARAARAPPTRGARVRRQRRGHRRRERRGRRHRHRRLHRQRHAQGAWRASRRRCSARPRARRRRARARKARRRCCCGRRCARSATRSIPRGPAAPICSGCAGSASCRTGASRATASRRRSLLAARGVPSDVVGRTHAALEAAGALQARPPAAASEPAV